jgi:hypothetical protein
MIRILLIIAVSAFVGGALEAMGLTLGMVLWLLGALTGMWVQKIIDSRQEEEPCQK